jgi:hypothetical protein
MYVHCQSRGVVARPTCSRLLLLCPPHVVPQTHASHRCVFAGAEGYTLSANSLRHLSLTVLDPHLGCGLPPSVAEGREGGRTRRTNRRGRRRTRSCRVWAMRDAWERRLGRMRPRSGTAGGRLGASRRRQPRYHSGCATSVRASGRTRDGNRRVEGHAVAPGASGRLVSRWYPSREPHVVDGVRLTRRLRDASRAVCASCGAFSEVRLRVRLRLRLRYADETVTDLAVHVHTCYQRSAISDQRPVISDL